MNYTEASKTPKRGWKYAEGDQLIVMAARIIAEHHCLQVETVFDWAKKHCPDLYDRLVENPKALMPPDWRILEAMMNDRPLAEMQV